MNYIKVSLMVLLLTMTTSTVLAQQSSTPVISQQALVSKLTAKSTTESTNIIVLDVRTPDEFAEGHIKGAINISHDQINNQLDEIIAYKDQTVVVHCRSGRRAVSAEQALIAAGFSDVLHLEGDILAWQAAKLPLEK